MKKIIIANYRYFVSGGPEVYMFKFMDNCEKINYEAIPFSVNYNQNEDTPYKKYFISNRGNDAIYYKNLKKTPRSIWKIFQGAFSNKEAAKKIKKLIKDENPQVLYALQVVNTISPSIFKTAKKMGLKVVHRISDFNLMCPRSDFLRNEDICELCLKGNFGFGIKYRCIHNSKSASFLRCKSMNYHRRHHFYDYVDYFVTPTDFTRNKLIEAGFDKNKIVKIPTFIDASKIVPCYEHQNYLLFLGRLVPEKGAKFAIEALKYLKEFPDIKLKITGELTDRDVEIKHIIDENNLQDKVEFVGFKRGNELADMISNSIAVLCPAIWYENMPNSVIEAYAYGKPVIASDVGCFNEIIEDGRTGYLFEKKNAEDLASKIKLLLSNPLSIKELGKNAREKVERDYSSEQHFQKLKDIFG